MSAFNMEFIKKERECYFCGSDNIQVQVDCMGYYFTCYDCDTYKEWICHNQDQLPYSYRKIEVIKIK